jgi:rhamnulose-1-phosphate aldolase
MYFLKRINYLLSEISDIAYMLWKQGWAERNAGNISVNITCIFKNSTYNLSGKNFPLKKKYPHLKNNFILLTASGSRMRKVYKYPEDYCMILKINDDGNSYKKIFLSKDAGLGLEPSSELFTHLLVHDYFCKNNLKEKVLLHTHCTELIALSHIKEFSSQKKLNNMLGKMHPETKVFIPDGIGVVKFAEPGSEQIAKDTVKSFEKHKLILWEKHGCLSAAETLSDAYDIINIAAKSAKIFFLCKSAGYKPEGIPG